MSPDESSEKLELLVNDENRIVTYKILSQELKIHVNLAKKYLMDYLNAQKSKGINLEVYYFLTGFIEKDGLKAINAMIVSEDNLEKAKNKFSEITSCHIYSICKGTSKDEFTLYSADVAYAKHTEEHNKYSAIKHPNIEMRPPVLSKMQVNDSNPSLPKKTESQSQANGNLFSKSEKDTKAKLSESASTNNKDSPKETNDAVIKKSTPEEKKQKTSTLMSMWQKKEENNNVKKENHKPQAKEKEAKNAPKNNILSMFSRQAVKNADKTPVNKSTHNESVKKEECAATKNEKTPVTKEASPVTKKEKSPVTKKEESSKIVSKSENKKSNQKRKFSSRKSSKSKNNSDSESELQPKTKKHRRICTFDDSDSESEPEEEKERAQRSFFLPEDPIETPASTPMSDDEPIPPTPPVDTKGKAKVWKTIQKTYEDEDGFFVTKKEKEFVSEDEEDPLQNKSVKKSEEATTKKNLAVNKKQSSLMSFFKQK